MTRIRKKPHIDAIIRERTGVEEKKVRLVTKVFLEVMMECLSDQDEVHLDGFGKFRVTLENIKDVRHVDLKSWKSGRKRRIRIYRKVRVNFSKSVPFGAMFAAKLGSATKKENES